jgi:hypothetical protein
MTSPHSWEQAGYTLESADKLMTDIREQLLPLEAEFFQQSERQTLNIASASPRLPLEAEFFQQSEYGPKYRIRGTLKGPNGRLLRVVSIWITEEATGQTKFVTLYPDKT